MKSMAFLLCAFFYFFTSLAAEGTEAALAWRSKNPIIPANFEAYFPDEPNAAAGLNDLPNRADTDDAVILAKIRQGLRHADSKSGNEWIKWLGQQLIAGREQKGQSP